MKAKLYVIAMLCMLSFGCAPYYDDAIVAQGQVLIRARFPYPDNVEFRGLFYNEGRWFPVVCGEVDGEKVGGGRFGFQRFIATRRAGFTILETEQFPTRIMPSIPSFDTAWEFACL